MVARQAELMTGGSPSEDVVHDVFAAVLRALQGNTLVDRDEMKRLFLVCKAGESINTAEKEVADTMQPGDSGLHTAPEVLPHRIPIGRQTTSNRAPG